MAQAAIELIGINKSFGAVRANRDINLEIARGTIHGIVGENGAGKSTLMSILYGFYQADSGEIRVGGKPASINTPNDAIALGIGMVHQHFMLVDNFSVLENIILGAESDALLKRSIAKARSELERLEHSIVADAAEVEGEKWIVTLGDYIDRGPASAQVVRHLMAPPPAGFRRISLAGKLRRPGARSLMGTPCRWRPLPPSPRTANRCRWSWCRATRYRAPRAWSPSSGPRRTRVRHPCWQARRPRRP